VVWAHGFQDADEPVSIPEDQLCGPDFCIPDLITAQGFAFATNSYSKTGLAVLQGKADVLDLVRIFATTHGRPARVYVVGASEGGLIAALAVEQHPDVFSAGVSTCGPIGSFPAQINYFGDARVLFDVFFPGVIPGDPFNPPAALVANWRTYYETTVKPLVFSPARRGALDQWVAVAKLPFDPANRLATLDVSVRDALRYPVINIKDATQTLGGFPFDNRTRWYTGSSNDFLLNLAVRRVGASPVAVRAMNTLYATTGRLRRPLITMHTTLDQQVPQWHQQLYTLKTLAAGTLYTRHVPLTIDRYGHCNFNAADAQQALALMLIWDGLVP
jgi:pimeloyl-ACP methyl ester carboxylesterase